VLGLLLSVHL